MKKGDKDKVLIGATVTEDFAQKLRISTAVQQISMAEVIRLAVGKTIDDILVKNNVKIGVKK